MTHKSAQIGLPAGMEQPDAYSYQLGIDAAKAAFKNLGSPTTNMHVDSLIAGFLGATLTAVSGAGGDGHAMRKRLIHMLENAVHVPRKARH